jgi:hypothetical protein
MDCYNKEKMVLRDESALFLDLLEGRKVIIEDLQQQFILFGWKEDDKKILLKISTSEYYEENAGPLLLQLEKNFVDCVILEYESSIVMVVDLEFIQ